ncbi:hypothetical protein DFH07DRAFT_769580 [Mycena maculata]|uniref:Uncharacterized protein n=1 Tax=Mycena maculata TaxID=230809 RepID=A0AAD7NM43_9AGAR|nr:hypothetical protein DFH07DRAFT_769580 [Mycena maculata]
MSEAGMGTGTREEEKGVAPAEKGTFRLLVPFTCIRHGLARTFQSRFRFGLHRPSPALDQHISVPEKGGPFVLLASFTPATYLFMQFLDLCLLSSAKVALSALFVCEIGWGNGSMIWDARPQTGSFEQHTPGEAQRNQTRLLGTVRVFRPHLMVRRSGGRWHVATRRETRRQEKMHAIVCTNCGSILNHYLIPQYTPHPNQFRVHLSLAGLWPPCTPSSLSPTALGAAVISDPDEPKPAYFYAHLALQIRATR